MSVTPRGRLIALGLAAALIGCDQPTGSTRPRSKAPEVVNQDIAPANAPEPAPAPIKPREILNQRTQQIGDAAKEKQAGGVVKDPKITVGQAYALLGNAYVSIVSQAAQQNITHALDLYQAETGEYPKSHAEFMEKIIKANNMALPTLPFYQEYAYDVPTHKLLIMEYPDRKATANDPK